MPCTPQKTLESIISTGNDYLVALKANQGNLYRQVQAIVACRPQRFPTLTTDERHHGRRERRSVRVFSSAGLDTQQWPALKSVLLVERQSWRQGKLTTSKAYYLSSLKTTLRQWFKLIRGHWSIENRLHCPKDVVLNASLFRSILLNLVRLKGWDSLTSALRELANQVQQIFSLLQ